MDKIKSFFKKTYEIFDLVLNTIYKGFKFVIDNGGIFIFALVLLVLAHVARMGSMDIVSHDVNGFLRNWYKNFYENGAAALGYEIGDYTPAYLYFLYFISLFKFDPFGMEFVYAIKFISIAFDYISAVFVFLIARKFTKNNYLSVACAGLFLFVPTIFLNAAFWGQCDGIYVSFIIISIYCLLSDKHHLSFLFLGLSFAFKLQAIFILPIYLILALKGKTKFRYFAYIPLVYVIMAIPSMIFGRSFSSIMNVYINQTANSYSQLTLNSSTFYALIFHNFQEHLELSQYGVCLAIAITGIFMYLIYALKVKVESKQIVTIALFFAILMPFFMPHMHERYFYLADALCILYVILNPKKVYVAPLVLLPSLMCYMLYLFSISFVNNSMANEEVTLRFGAILYIVALIILGKEIFTAPREENKVIDSNLN